MENMWALASLWGGLALVATLVANWQCSCADNDCELIFHAETLVEREG
jgi:hypothetical protein